MYFYQIEKLSIKDATKINNVGYSEYLNNYVLGP